MKKLNTKGFSHIAILAVFIVGFASIGAYLLVKSHAATNTTTPTTITYGSVESDSFYVNNVAASLVNDYLSQASGENAVDAGSVAAYRPIKVAVLKQGDTLTLGGKGADSQVSQPQWLSTRTCYVMRTTGKVSAQVKITSGRTARYAVLKPTPISGAGNGYWEYECVNDTTIKGNRYTYNAKVVSGVGVRIYRVDILNTLAY